MCGIGYYLHHNCNNISLIGCGAEDQIPRSSAYPGVDYQVEGGVGNTLISCYSRNNVLAGIRLLGGGKPVVIGYRQIGTCTYSIVVDANVSGAVIEGESVGSPMSFAAGSVGKTGNTANRPTDNLYLGLGYYDITLKRPIYWNGSNWTDASGTNV